MYEPGRYRIVSLAPNDAFIAEEASLVGRTCRVVVNIGETPCVLLDDLEGVGSLFRRSQDNQATTGVALMVGCVLEPLEAESEEGPMEYEVGRRYRIEELDEEDSFIDCDLEGRTCTVVGTWAGGRSPRILLDSLDGVGMAFCEDQRSHLTEGVPMCEGIVLTPIADPVAESPEESVSLFQALSGIPRVSRKPPTHETLIDCGELAKWLDQNAYVGCTPEEKQTLRTTLDAVQTRLLADCDASRQLFNSLSNRDY